MMESLRKLVLVLPKGSQMGAFTVEKADDFEYKDPVDGSVSSKQGIRFVFSDGSRIIVRLSGTGSVGATIRLYLEKFEASLFDLDPKVALDSLIKLALQTMELTRFIGTETPTVIT